jgi:hypothetical protein
MCVNSHMKVKDKYRHDEGTFDSMTQLGECLRLNNLNTHSQLQVFDSHCESSTRLYHAAPYEEGHAWEDWVVFDLSCDQDAAAVDRSLFLVASSASLTCRNCHLTRNWMQECMHSLNKPETALCWLRKQDRHCGNLG